MKTDNSQINIFGLEKVYEFLLKIVYLGINAETRTFEKRQRQFFNITVLIFLSISFFFIITNTLFNWIADNLNFNDKVLLIIFSINIISLGFMLAKQAIMAFFFNFYGSLLCVSWIESKLILETNLSTYTDLIPFLIIYGRFAFHGFWESVSVFATIFACVFLQTLKFLYFDLSFDPKVTMDLAEYFTIVLIIDRVTVFYKRDFIHLIENLEIISEQNQIIEQQAQELSSLNEFKTTLFMLISKDVREPLASLSETFQIYRSSYKQNFASIVPDVQLILNEISLLLDNLLFWSKNEVYNLSLKNENIHLNELIEGLALGFESKLRKKATECCILSVDVVVIQTERQIISLILKNLIHKLVYSELHFDKLSISLKKLDNQWIITGKISVNKIEISGEPNAKDEKLTDLSFLVSKVFSEKLGFELHLYFCNNSCVSFILTGFYDG